MSVGLAFGCLMVLIIVVLVGAVVSDLWQGRDDRKIVRDIKVSATLAKSREKIATKALRSIANGAGSPILEAQIALDEIEQTYNKELP